MRAACRITDWGLGIGRHLKSAVRNPQYALLLLLAPAAVAQPLTGAAQQSLAARFPDQAQKLEVRVEHAAESVRALDGTTVVWPASAQVPRGRVQVRVQDARGAQVGVAMLYVAHFDTLVLATTDVSAGSAVVPEALTLSWRETTRLAGAYLTARDLGRLPAETFATRLLRADTPLRPTDLRPPFAAEAGAPVVLHYTRGPLRLVLSVEAREAGYVGDAIRLYAADTRTTYRARLTAPGEATWLETL